MTGIKSDADKLISLFSEEKMREISASIIEAYRTGDLKTLKLYGANMELPLRELADKPAAAFRRMILFYHPDRRTHIHRKIREWADQGKGELLEKLGRSIRLEIPEKRKAPRPRPAERESYGYDPFAEDLNDGDFIYTEKDTTRMSESETFDFVEAVRSYMYGNLHADFFPKDLYCLDGELDLSEEGIADLAGIEYCINITDLVLSRNRISNLSDISALTQLQSLDLSRNDISYLDGLENLYSLVNLDLSFNSIEDIAPLERMASLRFVNLIGNPVKPPGSIAKLRGKGITVIIDG